MKSFGTKRGRTAGFTGEYDRMLAERAAAPDQLSVVWSSGSIASASPQSTGVRGSYSLDIIRYPADVNLGEALDLRRTGQLGLPNLSERTVYSTVVSEYSERTRILALTGEQLAMRNDELAQWLVDAERQMIRGTDNHPLFETSIEDTVCTIGRLPNGQVTMTEVPRVHVNSVRDKFRFARAGDSLDLTIETPVRCVARYFLTAMPEGENAQRPGKETEVTAFLLVGKAGFSWGLWSPRYGLFNEYSFLAPKELSASLGQKAEASEQQTGLNAYVNKAFDQLFLQLTAERLDHMQLASYAQVVWACETGLADVIRPIATRHDSESGIECFQIPVPVDEAAAAGLLFGTFAFGDTAPAGAQILPQVDLSKDLLALADTEEVERRHLQEQQIRKQRSRAVMTLLAAPVIATAVIVALTASLFREQIGLTVREVQADSRTTELKPALDRRKSYEANLKWYQEFITQVSALRRQQPVGIGLLYELNKNYPLGTDPSFYVSEMKLTPAGAVELKGLSRNKDAIATFLKSLEFAGGEQSGSRLFGNLAYEVQEGVPPNVAAKPGVASLPGAAVNAPPGVVAWRMSGNYLPMVEFAPPDPNKKPPAAPAATSAPAPPAS
jgi:hypothetical protein